MDDWNLMVILVIQDIKNEHNFVQSKRAKRNESIYYGLNTSVSWKGNILNNLPHIPRYYLWNLTGADNFMHSPLYGQTGLRVMLQKISVHILKVLILEACLLHRREFFLRMIYIAYFILFDLYILDLTSMKFFSDIKEEPYLYLKQNFIQLFIIISLFLHLRRVACAYTVTNNYIARINNKACTEGTYKKA